MDTQPPQNPAADISPFISQPLGATASDGAEAALADTSHRSRNRGHRVKSVAVARGPAPGNAHDKEEKSSNVHEMGAGIRSCAALGCWLNAGLGRGRGLCDRSHQLRRLQQAISVGDADSLKRATG